MKRIVTLLLLIFAASRSISQPYTKASFYLAAHPDDWQLFMGTDASEDILSASGNTKVILIYTTAGDNSNGGTPAYNAYCHAREDGANRSIQFCADIFSGHTMWDTSYTFIKTQSGITNKILRLQYKNIVSYFLKLSDGCFEHTNINTLSKFAYNYNAGGFYADYCRCAPAGEPTHVAALTNIDSTATYKSYYELEKTIAELISNESSGIPQTSIHAPDTDPFINPGDHPDHVQTGALAIDVANMINSCSDVILYQDYNICNNPSNLTPAQISMKAALLSQVSYGLNVDIFPGEWDPESSCGHVSWTSRNYSRVLQACDSIPKTNTAPKISLFPNPTASIINISYMAEQTGNVEIAIYDLTGKMFNLIVNENKERGNYIIEYDVHNLPTADYILYVKTASNINTLKFTKE